MTLGILVSIAGLASVLMFAPFLQVSVLRVEGADRVSKEQVESRTRELLGRRYGFLQTRSILFARTHAIAATLLKEFSEIETIAVSRDFPHALVLGIRERLPVLLACNATTCMASDAKGVAFPRKETDTMPKVILPATALTAGNSILSPELISFLIKTGDALKSDADTHIGAASFTVREEERVEVDTREGWTIIMSPTSDVAWQFAKLKAVLAKQISPSKRPRLEYIDLRFGDRAFMKYKTR